MLSFLLFTMIISDIVTEKTAFAFSTASSLLPSLTSSTSSKREFSPSDVSAGYQYPWSNMQDWVLRDSLPKFTIRIPIEQKVSSSTSISTSIGKIETTRKMKQNVAFSSFVLWRSLIEETPELSGYPIDFLQARYKEQQKQACNTDDGDEKVTKKEVLPSKNATSTFPIILDALPFLDDYEFSNEGGISATVYGLKSVADGSRITTPAVINVKESLPKGYIQTSDGSAFFELGVPIGNDERKTDDIPAAKKSLEIISGIANTINVHPVSVSGDADGLLLRLGGTTGILLAGATAINMLSHHMTVNLFWV